MNENTGTLAKAKKAIAYHLGESVNVKQDL